MMTDSTLAEDTIREARLVEVNGMLLTTTRYAVPAGSALTPAELEEKIMRLRAEAEAAEKAMMPKKRGKPLGKPKLLDTLKLVNCASCGATLLGESQERRRKRVACARLYPPVAGRLFGGRPYCGGCFDELNEEGKKWISANTSSAGTTAASPTS